MSSCISSTRVPAYAECIYVLTEYLKYLSIYEGIAIFFASAVAASQLCLYPATFSFNSSLTPRFVQLFSRNSSVNLFAVYLFKYKLFIKILSFSLNTMLIVDKHCSDVCCDEFQV